MDKVIITSLSAEDLERLSYMASYLLQLNFMRKERLKRQKIAK